MAFASVIAAVCAFSVGDNAGPSTCLPRSVRAGVVPSALAVPVPAAPCPLEFNPPATLAPCVSLNIFTAAANISDAVWLTSAAICIALELSIIMAASRWDRSAPTMAPVVLPGFLPSSIAFPCAVFKNLSVASGPLNPASVAPLVSASFRFIKLAGPTTPVCKGEMGPKLALLPAKDCVFLAACAIISII